MPNYCKESRLLHQLIKHFELRLSGLNVYTEAASGSYLFTPILAALAGAEKVFAQTRDSRFATANEVHCTTMEAARAMGVGDRIVVLTERCHRSLSESDIVTNSGFVRPFDADLIACLKPTAVIPLMWETWEFRPCEFDLEFCRTRGILVLGTKEQESGCDMRCFTGLTALKLLFDLGFDGGKVLLLGNAPMPGRAIVDCLRGTGIDVTWASAEPEGDLSYERLREHFSMHGGEYDVMMLAEHQHTMSLIGPNGLLDTKTIADANPALSIAVMTGNVDVAALQEARLRYLPDHIAPVGFMSYQPCMIGPRPVLTLFAGGLKVGEAMARARLKGMDVREAVIESMTTSPAMDFQGDLAWA